MIDRAATALEEGSSLKDAAALIAVSVTTLRNWAARHARLAAAMPPQGTRTGTGRPSTRTPSADDRLKSLWANPAYTLRDIAKALHVTPATARVWARKLGLPSRDGTAYRRQYQRDQHPGAPGKRPR
ncbi:helix-turn-helix domain-containing protein [Streptomyces sp. NBC_00237]|uniref:hypothetical protein n=1 Tax=Streptomyces sp. NBC_00237 TaxID=2975687 RepID=UPI002250ADE0|nr:hypothetical protein [Streptomyces sp. NBC_00237]MCX5207681.1 helix-turn-helix domain-containing protein [Streptomyces sp. NBC_00237]